MFSEPIYIACICILLVFCLYLIKKLYEFSVLLIDLEDTLEECLSILDHKHQSISKVLEIPIFFDSVEVRQVMSDIKASHNAVAIVANKLTNETGMISEIKKENDQKTEVR